MGKRVSIFLVLMLLFQTITSSVFLPLQLHAEESEQNIFTNITLEDKNGNDVQVSEQEVGETVYVHIDWSIKDVDIQSGTTHSLELSDELDIENEQEGSLTYDDVRVGEFQATYDGKVTATFNDEATLHPEASGTLIVEATVDGEEEATEDTDKASDEGTDQEGTADENEASETDEKEVDEDTTDETELDEEETDEVKQSTIESKVEESKRLKKENTLKTEEKHGFNLELDEVTDLEGNPFTEENLLDPQDEFKLKLDWTLEDGHNYVAGDMETFDLPKGIEITEDFDGELRDEFGQIVAYYTITTDKTVELVFTDYVETHSNVKGWLEIISILDKEEVEVEDGEAILDPIGEEGEIRIPIEEGNKDKTIEKKGTPNKGYNADEIHWEVIINKNKTSLTDAKIIDSLPEGTEYKEGSLVVTKLKVDLYGNILGDLEAVEGIEVTIDEEGNLLIPLDDINDAYRIEYVTTVTEDEEVHFTNNVVLSDEELEDVPANATVTINRGEAIKKKAAKGYDPKTGIIEWEIEVNYNEKDLVDVTLKDVWTPEGKLELVEDSVVFTEMEIDENGHAHETGNVGLPEGAEVVPGKDQFEVTGISTDKPYKVTYQTKVTDRVLDPFDVANTAGFGTELDGSGTGVGTYYGSKSAGTIDYKNKTIDWKIEINHDEYPMEKISIVDTLGEGLTLRKDSIAITVDGEAYDGDYTLEGDNPFTIEFPGDFKTDKKIVITYKTNYDADEVPDQKPTNKADITWTPEGEDESITKEVAAGTKLNDNTKNNDWKNGSYNPETKEITWTIYTNYRENQIDNLIINDAPQGNQKIVSDSVVVKELAIAENGNITEGDTLESSVIHVDEDANTLQVTIGNTDKAYKIEYKTSLVGLSDIQKEYVNKAQVWDSNEKLSDLDAKVGISKHDMYGDKSGYQDGKQVHWSISVNLGQQKINDLKLEDTISDNQEYLVDTIKVYHANVDVNGNATKGEEVPANEYVLSHESGQSTFTIEWKEEVERAFIVEYSTLFFAGHQEEITNKYNITGDSITEEDEYADGNGSVTIRQFGSGGGSGEAGYLIIDKVDTTFGREEAKLAGAEFDLIDADTGKVLKTGKTDENGHIDFGRLLFGEYELHERVVPEGFVTPEERQTIVIDKKYEPGDDKESFEYTVENYEPVFAIELLKTDDENNALAGAEFTLFDSDDNEIATETTDVDGKILFKELEEAGTYYVQETKAPAGFILDSTKYRVTIGAKEQEPVTISFDNTARGTVQLMKVDQDTNEPLEGVKFELQRLNDAGEYETVKTYTTDENGMIETENTLEVGEYRFVEKEALDGYRTNEEEIQFTVDVNDPETHTFTMTNEKQKGSIKLIKEDAATGNLLAGAQFKLVDSEGEVVQENLKTNDQGEIVVDDLLLGTYQLIETEAPEGYELDETLIEIEITEDLQVVEITATNHKLTNISVEKQWNNAGGETTPVTVKLLPTEDTLELNKENDWKGTFKDLRVYDDSGNEIDYQVVELDVEGYESEVIGGATEGFTIINTELTSITGTKTWLDGNSEDRPESITVKLLGNGEETDQTTEATADSNWEYTFTDLLKYDDEGAEIIYTVEEEPVEGYETSIDGYDLTNLRVGETEVAGTKTWLDDESEERPESITVKLLANGEETGETVQVTEESDWEYAFTNLPQYDDQGVEIIYTVEEEPVEGYETSINGYDITNLRVGTTEVEITKFWKDEQETDRPDTIKVNLLQNGEFYGEYEDTKEDDWKLTITDLPKYDEAGVAYEYSVTEHDVPGYAAEIDGFEITNTRADVKTIEITKTWLDDNSQDRPQSIEVELYRSVVDGEKELVDTFTITEENGWLLEITELPAFNQAGKAYTYKIEEKSVEGYVTSVNGFELTNLRVGEIEVTGTKTWLDDESEERPESITVKLLANGEETSQTVEVTEESNWEYAFTNLPQYDDQGVEITYTVDEEGIEGYEKSIDGNNITNVRVGKTEVSGTKTWKDDNAEDRPESIKVNLLQNGIVFDTVEVTAEDDWKYSFTELDKYDSEGVVYEYTVKEHGVPGYKSEVEGFDITNIRSGLTSVVVTKGWLDNDSKDRPDSITVNLLQNGEVIDTVQVTAAEDWTYEFPELDAYDENGVAYEYTIEEEAVEGYETTIDGYDITNVRVGTTEVSGTKTWKDDELKDRPDSITVNLLANGKKVDSQKVTAAMDWKYAFTNLPAYGDEGKAIKYTVEEVEVPGYKTHIDGFDITNILIPDDPKDPTKPEKPEEPSEPVSGDPKAKDQGDQLPKTATNMYVILLIGSILLASGIVLWFLSRRREDTV